jgi:hypothetical protein
MEKAIFIKAISKLATKIRFLKFYQGQTIVLYLGNSFIQLSLIESAKMDRRQ